MTSKKITTSPCIRNCCLNEKDVCLGCFRHIDEIVGWSGFTDEKKIVILDECTKRQNANKDNKMD